MASVSTYRFQEVKVRTTRKGACSYCGKRTTRSATFVQTLSPFNKNTDGYPCTYGEVHAKVSAEAAEWDPPATHFDHDACAEAVNDL